MASLILVPAYGTKLLSSKLLLLLIQVKYLLSKETKPVIKSKGKQNLKTEETKLFL